MKKKNSRVWANAKVNLALHIVGEHPSGLHFLDSLVAFPAFGDELIFERAEGLSLRVTGPFSNELLGINRDSTNLVLKAAQLLMESNKGADIELVKNLPVASGIGGGSSDAATTLQALSQLWEKQLPSLEDMLELGSDVPVCLSNSFKRMQGVGERITLLPQPSEMWIVLANPGVKVPTAKVFGFLQNKSNRPLESFDDLIDHDSFFGYLSRQRNDLEDITCSLFPEVKLLLDVINATPKCRVCRMSGSGSTCFGLYTEKAFAISAVDEINKKFPGAWAVSAALFSADSGNNKIS